MSALSRLQNFLREREEKISLMVSAPARIDILNTHQDYKGLSTVSAAINLRLYMAITKNLGNKFEIISLDLENSAVKEEFFVSDIVPKGRNMVDYFRAVIQSLILMVPVSISEGYRIVVSSDIPVGKGLGSSGALEVAFAKIIIEALEIKVPLVPLAEIAFRAENRIMGIPCGRLDQYSSAFGGVLCIKPSWPPNIERVEFPDVGILVIDSGVEHRTSSIHPVRQKEIDDGLRQLLSMEIPKSLRMKLGENYYSVKWEHITEEELYPYIEAIDPVSAKRILFTIKMNELTKVAIAILKKHDLSIRQKEILKKYGISGSKREILFSIIDTQHELLRDLYDVSLPKIENIVSAIRENGGVAKISGAGLGGTIIAFYSDFSLEKRIIQAAYTAGATKVWKVRVDDGVRIEKA